MKKSDIDAAARSFGRRIVPVLMLILFGGLVTAVVGLWVDWRVVVAGLAAAAIALAVGALGFVLLVAAHMGSDD